MRRKKLFGARGLLTLLLCISALSLSAQTITVRGTVTDESREPVIGGTVIVKGQPSKGTITDVDGNYVLNDVPADGVLTFSYVGLQSQDVRVNSRTTIDVEMKSDTKHLDEVVVVGFGTQKKVNLTGAVSTVDTKELASRPVANVSQALQGVVPGLNISVPIGGGELDNALKINIRGSGSIGDGSEAKPLVLIDGMEGNIDAINPQDIESISVLKDAASSVVYGSRAPFGVILITTKSGKEGRTRINYNNNFRFSDPIRMPKMMDSYSFAEYFNTASENGGGTPIFTDEVIERIKAYQAGTLTKPFVPSKDGATWDMYSNANGNNDWFAEHYRSWAPSQEHNLSVSGGTQKINYILSANLMDQRGLLRHSNDKLKRYSITAKINSQLSQYIQLGYTARWVRTDYDKAYYQNALLFHNIARRWPTMNAKDENGHYIEHSEIIQQREGGRDNMIKDFLTHQFSMVVEPIKNWKITAEANMRTENMERKYAVLPIFFYGTKNNPIPMKFDEGHGPGITEYGKQVDRRDFYTTNIFTDYFFETDKGHFFKAMAGFNMELNKYSSLYGTKQGLITGTLPSLSTATQNMKTGGLNNNELSDWATAGFFGRLNYNYKERYLLEFNLRYDGSSRFLRDQRWILLPAFSAGWNIAREDFWKDYIDQLSTLKLRGSWGELGNQNTTNLYPFYPSLTIKTEGSNWLINNKKPNTVEMPGLVSTFLTWERIRSWNVGLDFAALNNRLTGSFDWFNRTTLDMVGPAPLLPYILGTDVPKMNNADMRSYGFELEIGWRDRIRDFAYGVKAVLSDAQQEIMRYPNDTKKIDTWYEGKKVGEIWGYTTVGIAKTQAEMDAHLSSMSKDKQNALGGNWAAGDIMYADLNGDGSVNGGAGILGDTGDRTIIGNSTPRYNIGINMDMQWKNFDFSMFWQGVMKRDVEVGGPYFWGASGGQWQSAGFTEHWDFFRPEGHRLGANLNAYYPRPIFNTHAGRNQHTQTRYLQNGAYLRLKNIQLGYTLTDRCTLMKNIGVESVRFYVSADNILTFTKLTKIFDPETVEGRTWWDTSRPSELGNNGKIYPLSKVISFGFNVNF